MFVIYILNFVCSFHVLVLPEILNIFHLQLHFRILPSFIIARIKIVMFFSLPQHTLEFNSRRSKHHDSPW